MWMPSTNSVPGSRTGQACIMNAFKLRLAFSIFTGSSRNLGSFKEPLEVIEFFIAESRVVNRWFIVYSMSQFDLFGLRRETLQQRLTIPGHMTIYGWSLWGRGSSAGRVQLAPHPPPERPWAGCRLL